MTIKISFQNPWIPDFDASNQNCRKPLSELTADDHIHGALAIVISGESLPALGHESPDDVCLGAWAWEFSKAVRELTSADPSSFVYDEGEQGQPSFVFQRKGSIVSVFVDKSDIGGGLAIPEWGVQRCELQQFVEQARCFHGDLQAAISLVAPGSAGAWMRNQSIAPI